MQELQSLKNKILTLAIQGKLVPQTETDEPASILLQKIKEEKERLIQEKKLKKDTVISSAIYQKDNKYFEKIGDIEKDITKEIPFEIPKNWQWVRLGDIYSIIRGSSPRPKGSPLYWSRTKTKFHWITIRDITKNTINGLLCNTIEFLTEEGSKLSTYIEKGELIVAVSGSTTGKSCILDINGYIYDGLSAVINYSKMIDKNYLFLFFNWKYISLNSQVTGSAFPNINTEILKNILFPFPPLEEQKRIVKKVQELFTKIDCIEKNNQELDNLKATFKNKMLSLAIQGKLVPQAVGDEPASVLLQKIQKEKEQVVKEKKCKKETVFSTIYQKDNKYFEKIGDIEKDITKEIPFEIPASWEWVRFGNIIDFKLGKTPERDIKEYWDSNDISWVSISDMTEQNHIIKTKEKISNRAFTNKFNNVFSPKGTLLMSFKLTVGKTSILSIDAVHNEAIISIFPYFDKENYFRDYLYMFLPIFSKFGDKKEAIKGLTLNSKSLANILIPLPPLEEQHRITQKIEEIFALCEKL